MREKKIEQEDVQRLRAAWLSDDRYDPKISMNVDFRRALAAINDALSAGKNEEAVRICEEQYATYCMLTTWNSRCRRAYTALGKTEEAEPFRRAFAGIGASVMSSGDGKSPETAYVVMDLLEQDMVQQLKGLQKSGQLLMEKDGHRFDVITAIDTKTGNEVTLYFNVDSMFESYNRGRVKDVPPK